MDERRKLNCIIVNHERQSKGRGTDLIPSSNFRPTTSSARGLIQGFILLLLSRLYDELDLRQE